MMLGRGDGGKWGLSRGRYEMKGDYIQNRKRSEVEHLKELFFIFRIPGRVSFSVRRHSEGRREKRKRRTLIPINFR